MNIGTFTTDTKLETGGVWVEIGEGASLLVARSGNDKWRASFRRYLKPVKRAFDSGTLSDDKQSEIVVAAMADAILLDWKGMMEGVAPDEVEVPYSREKAYEWLLANRDFRRLVEGISEDIELFRREANKADATALGNESSGKRSGVRISKDSPT